MSDLDTRIEALLESFYDVLTDWAYAHDYSSRDVTAALKEWDVVDGWEEWVEEGEPW